jgi:IclR family acetate operon transcriptional repressor
MHARTDPVAGVTTQTPGLPRNQSLRRAVSILRVLAEQAEPTTTTALASAVSLPRATTARLLATLADAGLVDRHDDGAGWVLGYEATRLGRAADPYGVLIRRAQPALEQLTADSGESSVLAVTRPPLDVEIVSQLDAPNLLGVTNWVGRRFGLHASVSGKLAYARLADDLLDALLAEHRFERYTERTTVDRVRFRAELDLIRRQGYACSIDELEVGLTMIGVDGPARTARAAVASVGIIGPTSRLVPALDDALGAVAACARRLAELDW